MQNKQTKSKGNLYYICILDTASQKKLIVFNKKGIFLSGDVCKALHETKIIAIL